MKSINSSPDYTHRLFNYDADFFDYFYPRHRAVQDKFFLMIGKLLKDSTAFELSEKYYIYRQKDFIKNIAIGR